LLVRWFSSLVLCIVIAIGCVFASRFFVRQYGIRHQNAATEIVANMHEIVYIISAIVDLSLSIPSSPDAYRLSPTRYDRLHAVLELCVNSSRRPRSDYLFAVILSHSLSGSRTVTFSSSDLQVALDAANEQLALIEELVEAIVDNCSQADKGRLLNISAHTVTLFLWIFIAVWSASIVTALRVFKNTLMLTYLLKLVPEQHFALIDQKVGTLKGEDRIRFICDLGRGTILDLIPAPAALVLDDSVLTVNRLWVSLFQGGVEDFVGRALRLPALDGRLKTDITMNECSIVVLSDTKRENDHKQTMFERRRSLRALQGTVIPARLLDEGVSYLKAGFIVNCTIYLAPVHKDMPPVDWKRAVTQFETWIDERCKEECEFVDFLWLSPRDFMLIFGLAGLYPKELLVELAVLIAVDAMRWAVESRTDQEGYCLSFLITAGEGTEFTFNSDSGEFSVKGPVFERQALLRELNDCLNGLLICEETHKIWDQLRLNAQWELCSDDRTCRILPRTQMFETEEEMDMEE
jgi:hypothetical protein